MEKIDYTNPKVFAYPKPPKTEKKKKQPIKSKKHRQTKLTEISKKVKYEVWERDHRQCILCGRPVSYEYACCHYIPRSAGGLGIPENIFTACDTCHLEQDNGLNSEELTKMVQGYLKRVYGKNWNESKLIYRKYTSEE